VPKIDAPRFTGRDQELATLNDALAAPPAVVLVEGEAGIGKSRLVREYLSGPLDDNRRSLVSCCPPFRQPCTLGPLADALRQAVGDVPTLRLSALAGALRPLFPEWAATLPPAPEPVGDASTARYRLYRALAELLECLRIQVVVVEDVHWADETTLEFLLFLASRQHNLLSLVVTYRPEDVPADSLLWRLTSRLPAGTTSARITVGPLDERATAELVASMLDGKPVSAEFAAFLHKRTEGLPLAVEESVHLMADRADLVFRHGTWARRHLAGIEVPPTVRDAVLERAAGLGPDALAVIRAAAVLGEASEGSVVASVAGLAGEQARSGICEALDCGLLIEDFPNGQGLVFRHGLAAQGIYESMPVVRRHELHLRAGRALEKKSPLPLARLARHFREAGEAPRWRRYAERAADLALSTGDETTAAALLHDLITAGGLPGRDIARLANKIAPEVVALAHHQELLGALRAALEAGPHDVEEEAQVRCALGRLLAVTQDWTAARPELVRGVKYLTGDPLTAARSMILLGWPYTADCPATEHRRWLRRAAEIEIAASPSEQLLMRVNRITALLALGEEEGWTEAARISWDTADACERLEASRGLQNIGEAAMVWGRYPEAEHRLVRTLELAEGHHYLGVRGAALVTRLHLDWFMGAWTGLAERAGNLADDEDVFPPARLESTLIIGLLAAATGALDRAEECLRHVLGEARQTGAVDYMEANAILARIWLADNRVGDALQVTEEPVALVRRKGIWLWATEIAAARVSALVAAGEQVEAAELVAAFARGLRDRNIPVARAALATCRAVLAKADGQQQHAAAAFGRAAEAWHVLPRPYDALLAREQQARCLLAFGRDQDGLKVLSAAGLGLSRLGARGDFSRVTETLREYGVKTAVGRTGRPSYGDRISPRELDVLRLVITGRTDREIAEKLCLSRHTVVRHLESARRKLRVSSRTALAVAALESGVLDDRPTTGV
jgi:DNA-binding CsgD family transcriptional regulator/tetratricopeptide (TPR) repeat protein